MTVKQGEAKLNNKWTWPIILGLSSATGLVSALLADGWADVLAWFALGLPLLVVCAYGLRWKRANALCK